MTKKILFFTKYSRLGASSRLRSLQYIPFLNENECEIEVSSLYDDEYLSEYYKNKNRSLIKIISCYFKRICSLFSLHKYDFIYIEKELFPYLPSIFERILNILNIKYIVDYDDAVYHNYDSSNKWIVRVFLSKKINNVMRFSSLVIVGNQYLYNKAYESGAKNIELIPTVIDIKRYPTVIDIKYYQNEKGNLYNNEFVIGWIGSPYTQKYLKEIYKDILKLSGEFNIKLIFIGGNLELLKEFKGVNIEVVPWSEDTEVNNIKMFNVGIMPLPNENFEKGKCGYKLIQYMACGLPVVASGVGVNIDIINDWDNGYLISEELTWYNAIKKIILSPELSLMFSVNSRKAVEEYYSTKIQQEKLLKLFVEI